MSEVIHRSKDICPYDARCTGNVKKMVNDAIDELKTRLPSGFKWKIQWYVDYDPDTNPFRDKGYFGATLADDSQFGDVFTDHDQIIRAMFPKAFKP
jgi:hypothetical protein